MHLKTGQNLGWLLLGDAKMGLHLEIIKHNIQNVATIISKLLKEKQTPVALLVLKRPQLQVSCILAKSLIFVRAHSTL